MELPRQIVLAGFFLLRVGGYYLLYSLSLARVKAKYEDPHEQEGKVRYARTMVLPLGIIYEVVAWAVLS